MNKIEQAIEIIKALKTIDGHWDFYRECQLDDAIKLLEEVVKESITNDNKAM